VTEVPQEEVPVHEGPDVKDWPKAAPRLWGLVLNLEYLDRVIEALDGPVLAEDRHVHSEALEFMVQARHAERAALAGMILHSFRVELPEEPDDLATEAVGGVRGNSAGPGDRDHV
jgi:hypothetical protein